MKKYSLLRIFSFLFAISLLINTASAFGEYIRHADTKLATGVKLARGVFFTSDRQTEHYFEYTPNEDIIPVVVYGSKVCNYGDFKTMAALLERNGYYVLGGINGDFYDMSNYEPVGIVITDGILRSSDAGYWAIGFRADGSAFIARPQSSMRIQIGTENYRLGGINKIRSDGDYFLFSSDFSYTTKNRSPGRDVILTLKEPADDTPASTVSRTELKMNCSLELVVERIVDSNTEIELPEGKFVLSLSRNADEWRQYGINNMKPGDVLTLNVSSDPIWDSVENAVGSYIKLVSDGEKDASIPSTTADKTPNPRTAVGLRPDGTIILYTVDGRQSGYSDGFTSLQAAERLIELGCTDALLLDGGGSTNLQARYIGDSEISPVNSTSAEERSVTNYIMLVSKKPPSSDIANIGVYPFDAMLLAGSSTQFIAAASDISGRALALPYCSWSLSNDLAVVSSDGVFSAGKSGGTVNLRADYYGISGDASVVIVETPSSITIRNELTGREIGALGVLAGESVDLTADALYHSLELLCSDNAFTWSVQDGAGSIDENGLFTAAENECSGMITASAGDMSASIKVTVRVDTQLLEDFETADSLPQSVPLLSAEIEEIKDYVKLGQRSLKLDYESDAFYPLYLDVSAKMNYVSLWLYNDGSTNKLSIELEDGTIVEAETPFENAWTQMIYKLPFSGANIKGIHIDANYNGKIWLDHIMASTSRETDTYGPDIDLSADEGLISAYVYDAINGAPDKSEIQLMLDGKPLEFDYNTQNGQIRAWLPNDAEAGDENSEAQEPEYRFDGLHRLTLSARDKSGNITSRSVMFESAYVSPFGDMSEHWSRIYVNYMHSLGIVNGIDTAEGLTFQPDSPVSRAQFAVMIVRWLGIDTGTYSDTPLDFEDLSSIPDWALDYVKTANALGIIKGKDNGGYLYYDPDSILTREQAMTIIGRIQPFGFPDKEFDFLDAAEVSDWAERYVRSLVSQEVISGHSDGRLDPRGSLTRAQAAKILTEIT